MTTLLIRTRLISCLLIAFLTATGCSKKSKSSTSTGEGNLEEPEPGEVNPDPGAGTGSDNGSDTGNGTGTASGSDSGSGSDDPIGAGEVNLLTYPVIGRGDVLNATGEPTADVLVGVNADGSMDPTSVGQVQIADAGLNLTAAPAYPEKVICMKSLGADGTLLRVVNRSTNAPFFTDELSELAIAKKGAGLTPVLTAANSPIAVLTLQTAACETGIQATGDGKLYAVSGDQKHIWAITIANHSATPVVSVNGSAEIQNFLATSGGNIFFSTLDNESQTVQWRRADGQVVTLGYPNHQIIAPRPLGSSGFTFLTNHKAGGAMLYPQDNIVYRSFVEPIYGADSMTYWGGSSDISIGNWAASGGALLDPSAGKMASNPFWRSNGRFQGLVDLENQLYFDGSNIVRISYSDTEGIQVEHHRNIRIDASQALKVVAVFGPAQGFDDKWVGFATNEGFVPVGEQIYLYWVEIDPATGILDTDSIYTLTAPSMPAYWYPAGSTGANYTIPEFTPYRIAWSGGHRLVGLGGTYGASIVDLVPSDSQKTMTLSAARTDAYSYEHARAVINGGRLYFTASWYNNTGAGSVLNRIYYYDAENDVVTDYTQAIIPTAGTAPNQQTSRCNAALFYGLVQMPDAAGPTLLYCDTDYKVRLVSFNSFAFDTAGTAVQLEVDTPITGDDQGDFATGTVNNTNWMQTYPLTGNRLAAGLGRRRTVRMFNTATGAQVSATHFRNLKTEGRFEYNHAFIEGSDSEFPPILATYMAKWDSSNLFAYATGSSGSQISILVNPGARTITHLTALNNLAVIAVERFDNDHLLVSVTDGSGQNPKVLKLTNAGEKVSELAGNVSIKEMKQLAE